MGKLVKDGPLISIITPAYNAEPYIRETIQSVLQQTYPNWEMIIVDDASTDRTAEIVRSFQEEDDRIQLIRLNSNSGPARARNTAIQAAKGRYLAFLDSDDQWLPEKLERQLRFMQEKKIAFSFTQYRKMRADGSETSTIIPVPQQVRYKELLKHNVIGCLTVMLDRELVGPVEMPELRSRQDFALWLRLCKRGFTAYGLQEVLAKYRVGNHSVSSNKLKMALQTWKLYRHVEGLSLIQSIWYFSHYAYYSLRKYVS